MSTSKRGSSGIPSDWRDSYSVKPVQPVTKGSISKTGGAVIDLTDERPGKTKSTQSPQKAIIPSTGRKRSQLASLPTTLAGGNNRTLDDDDNDDHIWSTSKGSALSPTKIRGTSTESDDFTVRRPQTGKKRGHDPHQDAIDEKRKAVEKVRRMHAATEREKLANAARSSAAASGDACQPTARRLTSYGEHAADEQRSEFCPKAPEAFMSRRSARGTVVDAKPAFALSSELAEDNGSDEEKPRRWKMFHCILCNGAFTRRESVKNHFPRCVHNKDNPEDKVWDDHESCYDDNTGMYECTYCLKPFSRPDHLRKHEEKCPRKDEVGLPGPVIHECSVCHKIFSNAKNLKRHQAVCLSTNLDDTKNEASDFELPTESTQRQQTVPCPLCNSIQKVQDVGYHIMECRKRASAAPVDDTQAQSKQSRATKPAVPKASINIFGKPSVQARKQKAKQPVDALTNHPVLKPGRKRTLEDIPHDTLFDPKQVVSKRQFDQHAGRKKQRTDQKPELSVREVNTESLNGSSTTQSAISQEDMDKLDQIFDSIDDTVGPFMDTAPDADVDMDDHLRSAKTSEELAGNSASTTTLGNDSTEVVKPQIDQVKSAPVTTVHAENAHVASEMPPAIAPGDKVTDAANDGSANDAGGKVTSNDAQSNVKDPVSPPRPTIGGKRISEATLAVWAAQEKAEQERDSLQNEMQGTDSQATGKVVSPAFEVPEIVYIYFVNVSKWGNGLSEEKAAHTNLGPFFTLVEANTLASREVKSPIQHFENMVDMQDQKTPVNKPGWSYNYTEDENGMQTHKVVAAGMHTKASVRRGKEADFPSDPTHTQATEIPPAPNKVAIPAHAFRAPPSVYLVHLLATFHSVTNKDDLFGNDEPTIANLPNCEVKTLGTYTIPDLACKQASKYYIDKATQNLSASEKNTLKMNIRNELKELEADDYSDLFSKTVEFEVKGPGDEHHEGVVGGPRKGTSRVWVEKVDVLGPRN